MANIYNSFLYRSRSWTVVDSTISRFLGPQKVRGLFLSGHWAAWPVIKIQDCCSVVWCQNQTLTNDENIAAHFNDCLVICRLRLFPEFAVTSVPLYFLSYLSDNDGWNLLWRFFSHLDPLITKVRIVFNVHL